MRPFSGIFWRMLQLSRRKSEKERKENCSLSRQIMKNTYPLKAPGCVTGYLRNSQIIRITKRKPLNCLAGGTYEKNHVLSGACSEASWKFCIGKKNGAIPEIKRALNKQFLIVKKSVWRRRSIYYPTPCHPDRPGSCKWWQNMRS